jgi:hypothetical protein
VSLNILHNGKYAAGDTHVLLGGRPSKTAPTTPCPPVHVALTSKCSHNYTRYLFALSLGIMHRRT